MFLDKKTALKMWLNLELSLRDGPLEKLWGGVGNFRATGFFFRHQIPRMNFF